MSFEPFITSSEFHAGQGIRKALGADHRFQSWAPWIKAQFSDGGDVFTVGNQSHPPDNAAVIKGFQYSFKCNGTGGCSCELEIHDTQGGSFDTFFKKLNKKNKDIAKNYDMSVEFGWAGLNCDGVSSDPVEAPCTSTSARPLKTGKIFFMPMSISTNYESGKIKFIIEGVDTMQRMIDTREDSPKGSNTDKDKKVSMREAIVQMFDDRGVTVKFQRVTKKGKLVDVGFKQVENSKPDSIGPGHGGAQGLYNTNNNDPFRAALEWLKDALSEHGELPFVPIWDACKEDPTLIFLESPKPSCDCKGGLQRNMGTYLVNGGGESPVISFAPKIKWAYQYANPSGGGDSTAQGGGATKVDGSEPDCDLQEENGMLVNLIPTEQSGTQHGGKQNEENAKIAPKLNRAWINNEPISCQLTVQGDPAFFAPVQMVANAFSIIVVNPYHYIKSPSGASGDCGEWIAEPTVNTHFSNKNWIIKGITHQIKEGSFQTLFDMWVAAPMVNISKDQPIGCKGSGGVTVS